MSDYPPIPAPTPVLIQLLRALPSVAQSAGERVSVDLDGTLPALRVAKTGDQQAPSEWEAVPMYQIEVWDRDEIEAERLAWAIKNDWTSASMQLVGSDAVVHGRWVVQDPLILPANDDEAKATGLSRLLLTVAFRLTGVSNG